jgi:NAD(P)-dependent dehydrogenase (short-subunit alcohol dehydrogenase family)
MASGAVVTGAASGIGEAVCRKLASRGINLLVVDLQVDRGTALTKELEETHGVDTHFLRVDVMQEDDIKNMVATAVKRWGRLDYAANCAGICEKVWDEEESITSAIFDRFVKAHFAAPTFSLIFSDTERMRLIHEVSGYAKSIKHCK